MPEKDARGKWKPGVSANPATQWKPGQSGNPKGSTKRPSFEEIVSKVLSERIPGSDVTKREGLARVFVDMLLKRNGAMIKEFMARDWPVINRHQVEVEGSDPVKVPTTDERLSAVAELLQETLH